MQRVLKPKMKRSTKGLTRERAHMRETELLKDLRGKHQYDVWEKNHIGGGCR